MLPGLARLAWLKALNASMRNWKLTCSCSLKFLNRERLLLQAPGPCRSLRCRLPYVNRAGAVYAEASTQDDGLLPNPCRTEALEQVYLPGFTKLGRCGAPPVCGTPTLAQSVEP